MVSPGAADLTLSLHWVPNTALLLRKLVVWPTQLLKTEGSSEAGSQYWKQPLETWTGLAQQLEILVRGVGWG